MTGMICFMSLYVACKVGLFQWYLPQALFICFLGLSAGACAALYSTRSVNDLQVAAAVGNPSYYYSYRLAWTAMCLCIASSVIVLYKGCKGNLNVQESSLFVTSCFFSLRHFCHFFCRENLALYLTVALKLATSAFISLYFRHSDQNDLIFFGHLKKIQSMTKKKLRYDTAVQ